jgi:hypothetical protein
MKYNVRTNHQNVPNYVSVKTDNIEAAINYAVERTQENGYPYPLLVETEGHDEICIVVNGCCYQIEDEKKIIERERDERWH